MGVMPPGVGPLGPLAAKMNAAIAPEVIAEKDSIIAELRETNQVGRRAQGDMMQAYVCLEARAAWCAPRADVSDCGTMSAGTSCGHAPLLRPVRQRGGKGKGALVGDRTAASSRCLWRLPPNLRHCSLTARGGMGLADADGLRLHLQILETKVRKLEQLVRLKDAKIQTLMAKLQAAGMA